MYIYIELGTSLCGFDVKQELGINKFNLQVPVREILFAEKIDI
jgi:hypothetical protein